MTVSPEAEERKICPQNSHREGSSDESRNFRSHTNPEHPLKVAEELLLCVTNLIREKALLQCRDCKGKPPARCTFQEPGSVPCPSQRSRGFHRHPGKVPAPFFTHPPGSLLAGASSAWLACDTACGMSPRPADQDKHQDDTDCVVITRELLHPHTATGTACEQHTAQSLQNPSSPARLPLLLLFLIFF